MYAVQVPINVTIKSSEAYNPFLHICVRQLIAKPRQSVNIYNYFFFFSFPEFVYCDLNFTRWLDGRERPGGLILQRQHYIFRQIAG